MTRRAMDFIDAAPSRTAVPGACICPISSRTGPISLPHRIHACMARPTWCRHALAKQERRDPHPVYRARSWICAYSRNLARDEVREQVIPAYMGLIKQIDDQMGVLMRFLEQHGLLDSTMIVFTSDHGDYLGDHWMGEKDLFHDQSAKIPLIVVDPSSAGRRAPVARFATRWSRRSTSRRPLSIISAASRQSHFGRAFADAAAARRNVRPTGGRFVFSEYDYACRTARLHARPADRALPPVHGVRRALEIYPRLRLPADAVRSRRAIRRNCPTAAKTHPARRSSPGCSQPCSTGHCIPRTILRPAGTRSTPTHASSFRSRARS